MSRFSVGEVNPARMESPDAAEAAELSRPLLPPASDGAGEMGVDEMLELYAGQFGPWQLRHFALTSLAWALNALHTMVVVFADREPEGQWEGTPAASTAAEWGLVGEEKYKVGLAQSVFFAGSMIGAGMFGHLSDSFLGRKGALTLACATNAVFGFLTAFSPIFELYASLRFLTGISTGGVGLCAFVLATEPVGPSKRGAVGMSTFYLFSIGVVVLSIMAYVHQSWRALYITSSLPSLLFVAAVLPFISESPRWYLVRQKTGEAMQVMRAIAKRNGKHIPDGVSLVLDCSNSKKSTEEEVTGSVIQVIRSPSTRIRLFLATAINFLGAMVYYGLSLNVVNLKISLYLSVPLNAIVEMPAYGFTAMALKWYGRKPLTVGTLWFCGVFCMVGAMLPDIAGALRLERMVCGVFGIFSVAATFDLMFVYTAELFPTVVRNAGLGCVTLAGQMGAVVAPLLVALGGGWPFAAFAGFCILAGLLAFYLPETLNQPLYDTMAALEKAELEKGDTEKVNG